MNDNRQKLRRLILHSLEDKSPRCLNSDYHWWTGILDAKKKQICVFSYSSESFFKHATLLVALFTNDGKLDRIDKFQCNSADLILNSKDDSRLHSSYSEEELVVFIKREYGSCSASVIHVEPFFVPEAREEFRCFAHEMTDFLDNADDYADDEVEDWIYFLENRYSTLNDCHIDGIGKCVSS